MKILITGGSSGIGKGLSKYIAKLSTSHEIIILSKNKERCEETKEEIIRESGNSNITIQLCDLSKLSHVKKSVNDLQKNHDHIDVLFINAGLGYFPNKVTTEDGMDMMFQVNYLAQFYLLMNLLGMLEKSKDGGRIIFNNASKGKVYWDDLQQENIGKKKFSFERQIIQCNVLRRMVLKKLHDFYRKKEGSKMSFIGVEVKKWVWTRQLDIIPLSMKIPAMILYPLLGQSKLSCAKKMHLLFIESQEDSLKRSGKLVYEGSFKEIKEDPLIFDEKKQEELWKLSLDFCNDEKTTQIYKELSSL